MSRTAIIADDLTGALDAVARFATTGRAVLLIDGDDPDAGAVARSTGSRTRTPAAVFEAAELATSSVTATTLYVKIDSTLRGSPARHLEGALASWRRRAPHAFAVICPALPAMGRTTRDGRMLDGPVAITSSALVRDPLAPPRSASVTDAFPGSVLVTDLRAAFPAGRNIVVDAATEADLDAIASAMEPYGSDAVAVGSAGLAAAIARRRPGIARPARPRIANPPLVLITSAHPVARTQLDALGGAVTVVSTPDRHDPTAPIDPRDAARVAQRAAERAAALLASGEFGALVVIGGDGAQAALTALGARGVDVDGELLPGTPFGTIVGGVCHGLMIATRSGAFGGVSPLSAILSALTIKG